MKCYICNSEATSIGSMPFSKNPSGLPETDLTPMEYFKCNSCYFIFCPEMLSWDFKKFSEKVYNEEYIVLDPGYDGTRAINYKRDYFDKIFDRRVIKGIKHLDYGSGESHLSGLFKKDGWNSISYDPFSSPERPTGVYNLITAIEVFEHATNINDLIVDLKSFMSRDGVILFSTQLADKNTTLDWWYILARSGHIGVLSQESLLILAKRHGLQLASLTPGLHTLSRNKSSFKNLMNGENRW